jgi:hypothetical protein
MNAKQTSKNRLTPEEAMAQTLAEDRPIIEDALKNFLSLRAAQQQIHGVSVQEIMGQARSLSKAINGHRFPDELLLGKNSKISAVVAEVWNGLLDSKQKPTKCLGRLSLLHAWDDLQVEDTDFVVEFGKLLHDYSDKTEPTEDSDAHIIWEPIQGAELERRNQRRNERAEKAKAAFYAREGNQQDIVEEKEEEGAQEETNISIQELPDEAQRELHSAA